MLLSVMLQILLCISVVTTRIRGLSSKPLKKQLFLSRHIVTETDEFEGGVLVNESGIIEAVLKKDTVDKLLQSKRLQVVDGGDWALLAGGIDSHVHINEPNNHQKTWKGYVTATQEAAAGGITTIIDMPLNSVTPTTSVQNLQIKANIAKKEIYVDVGFWGGAIPGNGEELIKMAKAGVVGFKFLIDNDNSKFPTVTTEHLRRNLQEIFTHLNGTGTVLAFDADVQIDTKVAHCESSACPVSESSLYETYLSSPPDEMELETVSLIASYLNETDVHIHIVHASSAGVVPILEQARENRIKNGYSGWRGGVTGETCSRYLTLSSDEIMPGSLEFNSEPPIRNNTNKQKLWEYIGDKRLDLITSDHSPGKLQRKDNIFLEAFSVFSAQFDLPLFWTEAKARGLKLKTMSYYWSAGPARLTGLQEKKGSIRVGLDADLIFFDPNASFILTSENNTSPYMNRVLTGKVMQTYVRGDLVYSDGEIIGKPKGRLLLSSMRSHGLFISTGLWKTVPISLLFNKIISSWYKIN